MKESLQYCTKCLSTNMRPRLTFNSDGVCSACQWAQEKLIINWDERKKQLLELCDKFRNIRPYNCLVPVSGGKDGSYVADKMRNDFGMRVLTVTIHPSLSKEIGNRNLNHFSAQGYENLRITPNTSVEREINRIGFIEQGRPLLGWQMAVQAGIFKTAAMFHIPLIMYGEDGETEYGGLNTLKNKAFFGKEEIRIMLEGNTIEHYYSKFSKDELFWWEFPDASCLNDLIYTHYSYYENWNSYENGVVAKEKFQMEESQTRNVGTYTNQSQNDTYLYDLHTYLMYLKFGFGRCTQDCNIDIRRNALSREQAKQLVQSYDGEFPSAYLPLYMQYFDLTEESFFEVLRRHTNVSLFRWSSKTTVVPLFSIN